jgi:NAD(P)-dependent dehydrogenase (short-subunit alcohol dehydrogenase family)
MPGKLDGKVALITGGGTGIGLATAREFAREGAQVYITGRRKPALDAAAASIGPGVIAIQGDVTKLKDLDRIYGQIGQEQGRVDIVFANAAIVERVAFGSITEVHVDRVFGTNVKGLLFTAQKALPLMPDGGTIILAGSDVSIKGYPCLGVYSATKAAVRSFARTWTTDLAERGIRVNVISPGPVDTAMLAGHPEGASPPAYYPCPRASAHGLGDLRSSTWADTGLGRVGECPGRQALRIGAVHEEHPRVAGRPVVGGVPSRHPDNIASSCLDGRTVTVHDEPALQDVVHLVVRVAVAEPALAKLPLTHRDLPPPRLRSRQDHPAHRRAAGIGHLTGGQFNRGDHLCWHDVSLPTTNPSLSRAHAGILAPQLASAQTE